MLRIGTLEMDANSSVPIRNIRAYEQGKLNIAKAQADTVFALARALSCKVEDLIY